MDHFIIYAEEFRDVIGSNPQYGVIPNVSAHEGPVYVRDRNVVLFTSVPENTNVPTFGGKRIFIGQLDVARLDAGNEAVSVFRADTNAANGMTLDREGRLLICEQGSKTTAAAISRLALSSDAPAEPVVTHWFGLPLNSPNDVVVKSDGTIWFTDPSYGSLQGFRPTPLSGDYVYRHDPATGETSVVADSFNKPNGLAFSPDESILYINDSGAIQGPGTYFPALPHHIRAFDVVNGRQLVNDRLFAVITPGIPDGLKTDSQGRVYSSSFSGVQVFDPHGRILGEIAAPGVANFCFGGEGNNTLFMMCDTNITWATVQATG